MSCTVACAPASRLSLTQRQQIAPFQAAAPLRWVQLGSWALARRTRVCHYPPYTLLQLKCARCLAALQPAGCGARRWRRGGRRRCRPVPTLAAATGLGMWRSRASALSRWGQNLAGEFGNDKIPDECSLAGCTPFRSSLLNRGCTPPLFLPPPGVLWLHPVPRGHQPDGVRLWRLLQPAAGRRRVLAAPHLWLPHHGAPCDDVSCCPSPVACMAQLCCLSSLHLLIKDTCQHCLCCGGPHPAGGWVWGWGWGQVPPLLCLPATGCIQEVNFWGEPPSPPHSLLCPDVCSYSALLSATPS